MKKVIIFVIFIVLIIGAALIIDQGKFMKKKKMEENTQKKEENLPVRKPAVAGTFYPGNANELNSMIDDFLSKAELPKLEPYIRALIVPHAGYVYSGQVAAYGYKALMGHPPTGG